MRLRLPVPRAVLFGALFATALIATFPLRVILGAVGTGVSAREVRGSVWSGRLVEARAGAAVIGDLDARLEPLPLLVARARIALGREGTDPFTAAMSFGGATRAIDGLSGTVPVAGAFGALPVTGLFFQDVTVRFRDGRCDRAEGQVRASLAAGAVGGVTLPQGLSGAARCDRGALLLPLASASGSESVALRIEGDGRWTATATVPGAGGAAVPPIAGRLGGE